MADLSEAKAEARRAAYARRKAAKDAGGDPGEKLFDCLQGLAGRTVAGYWPIRTEPDPRPAMRRLAETRRIVLPVVTGAGLPLSFRLWTPGAAMVSGAFGAAIPAEVETADPDLLIVPLVAFDARGYRLGYGGGFYDRTLERLRAGGPVIAVGLAYSAQEVDALPTEATDQRLDMIVTEAGVRVFV